MSRVSEVLSVAYDSGDEDVACLVVAKKRAGVFIVLNEFRGAEANKLYHELVDTEVKKEKLVNNSQELVKELVKENNAGGKGE